MIQQTLPPRIAARVLARFVVRMLGGPGSGNFGHAGRPGEVGGSTSVPSGILAAIRQADGGFTYHAVTGDTPTSGFALSLHKDRERIVDASKVDLVTLATYARDNDDLLQQPGNYMGGWNNPEDGKVYLDVSTVVQTESEAQVLGARANQLAFFDLKQGKSIPVVRKPHVKAASAIHDGSDDWFTIPRRFGRARTKNDGARTDQGGNRGGKTDSLRTRELGGPGSGNFGHAGRPGEVGVKKLRGLGGPGSGNFGHAGRPGEVGGSAPNSESRITEVTGVDWSATNWSHQFEEPDEFFYHVTLKPQAQQILEKQELRPGSSLMGRGSLEGHSKTRTFLTDRNGVFFWAERIEAHAMDKYDDPPAISVLRIPKSDVPNAQLDPVGSRDAKAPAYFVEGKIQFRTGSTFRVSGGPGSGHFDHAGRPGEVGGSAPSGGSKIEIELPDPEEIARDKADTSGFPHVHPDDATQFDAPNSVVDYYVQGGFMSDVNPQLRKHEGDLSKFFQPINAGFVKKLDAEMEPLPKDTKLYRVLGSHRADFEEGDEFVDHGFMSTTRSSDALETIVEDVGLSDEYSHLVIHAPKGTPHINVNARLEGGHMYSHQKEIVLGRGLKYRVIEIETDDTPPPEKVIHVKVVQ